jgi:hypothetical protein
MEEVAIPMDLIKYTDNHFMNKLNEDLESVNLVNIRMRMNRWIDPESNSPISMSSDSESDDCFEHGPIQIDEIDQIDKMDIQSFKKLTFREVQASIDKYYEDVQQLYSNELDVLITYLKGQKHIYLKAADVTVIKMYMILFLAVIGSIILSVLLFIENSPIFLCGFNIGIIFLYFINIWFGWGSYIVCYRLWANQYERFICSLDNYIDSEMNKQEQVLEILHNVEDKLKEWKEIAVISLPWECKRIFPILCRVQFFTFIKRIETYKKNLIMKFKDIKNEIRYIHWKWQDNLSPKETTRLNFLYRIKEKIKGEILHHKNAYGCMQDILLKEIQKMDYWTHFFWSKKPIPENPAIQSYFSTIFEDD